jgi:hypothetical protein
LLQFHKNAARLHYLCALILNNVTSSIEIFSRLSPKEDLGIGQKVSDQFGRLHKPDKIYAFALNL